MSSNTTIASLESISFAYKNRSILEDINIHVAKNKITSVVGPSGCGKTTILKLLVGLLNTSQGKIFFQQQQINNLSIAKLNKLRNKIGYLFQSGALFNDLNVYENVAFPLREHRNKTEKEIKNIVEQRLEAVGLKNTQKLMPYELSGGMKRRVAIARATVLDPELILYDEPLTGQDPITKGVLVKLIKSLNEKLSLTTLLVAHDIQELMQISDYIYLIVGGKLITSGTTAEIAASDNPMVQQFLHGNFDGPIPFHYQI